MANNSISKGRTKAVKEIKYKKSIEKTSRNLCISKKCRTFAPDFEKKAQIDALVLSSSGLGQRPLTP